MYLLTSLTIHDVCVWISPLSTKFHHWVKTLTLIMQASTTYVFEIHSYYADTDNVHTHNVYPLSKTFHHRVKKFSSYYAALITCTYTTYIHWVKYFTRIMRRWQCAHTQRTSTDFTHARGTVYRGKKARWKKSKKGEVKKSKKGEVKKVKKAR